MNSHLITLITFLSVVLCGCATHPNSLSNLYGINDNDLEHLGRNLGYSVEALGMSQYRFYKPKKEFYLTAHAHLDRFRDGRNISDSPISVWFRKKELEIPMDRGITIPELESRIRSFINEPKAEPVGSANLATLGG